MGRTRVLVAIALLSFCLFIVEGKSLYSEEDHIEVERELRLINRNTVQTIKTEDGDIYNCVDIYNQPALQHPLLKNHKIQMQPTFEDMTTSNPVLNGSSNDNSHTLRIGLENGCPQGTVPIRKNTKEDLLRAKSTFRNPIQETIGPIRHRAVYLTDASQLHNILAASAYINVYNPSVDPGQYSAARIEVQTKLGSIVAGWLVSIDLYGDNRTRLFTSWKEGKKGCFNTLCSGFVHVNPKIPLDGIIPQISQVLGPQYDLNIVLTQDKSKNWWLLLNEKDEQVGYWPSQLFSDLKDGADQASWGGEVISSTSKTPPMGSGIFDFRKLNMNAYMRQLQTTVYKEREDPIHAEEDGGYYARDSSYKGDYWGVSFVFGGPGN